MGDKPQYQIMKNEDTRKMQKFLEEMNLEERCVAMRVKCYMIDCAENMRAKYRGREECLKYTPRQGREGPGMLGTQEHLEVCAGNERFRTEKDLSKFTDKVKYFIDVVKEKEEMIKRIRRAKMKNKKSK